jgi:two-component system, cell cycle response regulator DivK
MVSPTPFQDTSARLILLADRYDDSRQMYAEHLRLSAIEVDETVDGREALAMAISRRPDLVVTETRLLGIDGYQLCRLLRDDVTTCLTPIVVVTADVSPTDVEKARNSGADAILLKPCLPEALLAEVRRLIQRSKELRQQSDSLRAKAATQLDRAAAVQERLRMSERRLLSRAFARHDTKAPPIAPPALECPNCGRPLIYDRSHLGGASRRHREQWDYYVCPSACGSFQYRQRTHKLRHVM